MDKIQHSFKVIFVVLFIITNFKSSCGQDVTTFINSKRSINIVDDRFISIVVDPVILMSGLNISWETITLAKHLSPAYIRIQGFSTSQVSFSNNVDKDSSATKLTVTPAMWTSLNEWLISANLTPVFALSDRDRVNDAWNPKSVALPLMALADQMNTTCFWEIISDTAHKSLEQYANDVTVLRHILDAFPGSRKSWSVVGGELSRCAPPTAPAPAEGAEIARKLLERIEASVDAVDWTPNPNSVINFPVKINKANPSSFKRSPAVWTTAPRTANPTSFKDALIWAKYLGQVASNGYNVVFRQPKIKEFYMLTPTFWVSKFHKILMGNNVLDVRSIHFNDKKNCHVFAHCTKNKNYFGHEGTVTIFVVNLEESEINITTKFLGMNLKNNEIYNFILTSKDDNSSETYLNGDLLTISDLQDQKIEFIPTSRRAQPGKSIGLNLPAKSIGFFIIPISCPSACIHSTENLRPIHPISLEQKENSSIESEINTTPESMNNLLQEDSNEKYYKNSEFLQETRDGSRLALERKNESKGGMNKSNNGAASDKADKSAISFGDDITNLILERAKQIGREKVLKLEQKITDLKQLLTEQSVSSSKSTQTLHLNSDETKLKTENNQMAVANKIKKSGDKRRKRGLISLEMPNMQMETRARKTRRTSEEAQKPISLPLDPLFEYSCDCNKKGHTCNCGLKLATNIIEKMWGNGPAIIKDEVINYLRKPTVSSNKEQASNELQEIKMLLQKYHTDIRNILTTINAAKDENMDKSSETNKFTQTKSISTENMIPKDRMKRKLSIESLNENLGSQKLRQNRNMELIKWSRMKREAIFKNNQREIETVALPESLKLELFKRQLNHHKQVEDQLHHCHKRISDGVMAEVKRNVRTVRIQTRKEKSELNIEKREVLESRSDSVENISDDNRTTKFDKNKVNSMSKRNLISSDGDRTKEADTFLNEIPREGNNLPNYLKHIQEDVYLEKPDINSKDDLKQNKNRIDDISENKIIETKSTSTSDITGNKIMNLPQQQNEYSSSSEDEFVDAMDTEFPSSENSTEESNKEGLVDNVFHTMFDVLNDFHRKILEYLHYLSR